MSTRQPDPRIAKLSSRIHRTFRVFLVLTCAGYFIVGILGAVGVPNFDFSWKLVPPTNSDDQPIPLEGPTDYLIWVPASLLMVFLFLAPLYYFDRLLIGYRDGRFFSVENTRLLRAIGYLLIAQQLWILFSESLCYLLLLMIKSSGTFLFKISIEYNHVAMIGVSLVIIILARLMGLANEAIEDRELTI